MGTNHQNHDDVVKRLKRANGHLSKVVAMIEGEEPCSDVAQQLHAVIRALQSAKQVFIRDHIEHCLAEESFETASVRDVIKELKEISKYL